MATMVERVEGRARAVASLEPQVDELIVTIGDGVGDQVKFFACAAAPEGAVFLSADDDLVYPPDYVERLLDGLERYPGSIVGFHGWRVSPDGHPCDAFPCLSRCDGDHEVDVIGTGVCAFHVDTLRVTPDDFPSPNIADLHLALKAQRAGIRRVVLEHEAGWLTYVKPPRTIWEETSTSSGSFLDASAAKRAAIGELARLAH